MKSSANLEKSYLTSIRTIKLMSIWWVIGYAYCGVDFIWVKMIKRSNITCDFQLTMVLIKVADISNEARPMDIAEPWLDCLFAVSRRNSPQYYSIDEWSKLHNKDSEILTNHYCVMHSRNFFNKVIRRSWRGCPWLLSWTERKWRNHLLSVHSLDWFSFLSSKLLDLYSLNST